jgi:drug/metabolite transporter (DMT)-like permease
VTAQRGGWLPLAVMLLTVAVWAGNNVVSKIILREASPLLVALVRFTLAGLLFHLPAFLILRGEQRFGPAERPRILLLGVVGVGGSMVSYLLGLRTIPATDAAIYNLTTPLFVLLWAFFFFGERLSRTRMLGIAIAFAGAVVLVTGGSVGLGGGDLGGALFVLGNALIWSAFTLFSREVIVGRSPLLVLAAVNLWGMVAIWVFAVPFGAWTELPSVLSWSPAAWWGMLYLILLMSMASQFTFILSIRDLHPSQVSAFLYTGPLFTALFAAVTLGETPTVTTLLSGLLILAGVALVNRRAAPRRIPGTAGILPAPAPQRRGP